MQEQCIKRGKKRDTDSCRAIPKNFVGGGKSGFGHMVAILNQGKHHAREMSCKEGNGNLQNPAIEYGPGWLCAEYNVSLFKNHAIMYDCTSQYYRAALTEVEWA